MVIRCRSFEVELKTPKGKVYSLVINDLFEPIVPEDSFVKVCVYILGSPLTAPTARSVHNECVYNVVVCR